MSGLILKDLLNMKKQLKIIAVLLVLYGIIFWYLSDKLSSIICIERGKGIIIVPPVK